VRILIADDDPVPTRLLEATLTRLGHEVLVTDNGTDALAALVQPNAPRMAILDWMMPGLDGLAVCRAVREQISHYVYVLLLTSRSGREDVAAGLGAEADDFLTKPFDVNELQARVRSGERVLQLQEKLLAAQEALRHEATHDHLTQIWNRGRILDHLGQELARARTGRTRLTTAVADLDHFKHINDTYGHGAGDRVLRDAAIRLQSVLRKGDSVGRYGGEEFLLVLPSCDRVGAFAIAERARLAFERPFALNAQSTIQVTLSLGFASTHPGGGDGALLIQAADRALYQAKALGRNRVEVGTIESTLTDADEGNRPIDAELAWG
jgi:two-component system, cell cycle response regulator